MKIKEIEISNILSIESLKLAFEDTGLVLVEGWNHDAGRANGAGKTAIFNALSYCLFGKLPRKITASEVLRRGSKAGWVKVVVVCGKEVWTITRSRPGGVSFLRGQVSTQISQEEWETIIRLNYDQFLMSMYCSQSADVRAPRFLMTPDTDKKKFLLQLLNLNLFADAKKIADDKIKSLETKLTSIANLKNSIDAKIEAYSESLEDEKSLKARVATLDKEMATINKEIQELSLVSKPDLSKFAKLEDGIRSKQMLFASTKSRRTMLTDQYRKLTAEIHEFDKDVACGECGSTLDTPEARDKHVKHQEQILRSSILLKEEIDGCDLALSKEKATKDLAVKVRQKKDEETFDYDKAKARIADLNGTVKSKSVERNNAALKLQTAGELRNKIKALTVESGQHLDNMSSVSAELEIYKTVTTIYSPTGAQAYILDSVIDFFNIAVEKHIGLLWPSASYNLTSYKENSKGDVTAKFSEILTIDGQEVSVGSLSGGELKAFSLCVDFSILDVLESQFGISLNPIILDEPFDGLDVAGREIVVEVLEKLAKYRQIFVIDHASEAKAMFTKVIQVEKRSGVTSVIP